MSKHLHNIQLFWSISLSFSNMDIEYERNRVKVMISVYFIEWESIRSALRHMFFSFFFLNWLVFCASFSRTMLRSAFTVDINSLAPLHGSSCLILDMTENSRTALTTYSLKTTILFCYFIFRWKCLTFFFFETKLCFFCSNYHNISWLNKHARVRSMWRKSRILLNFLENHLRIQHLRTE